MDAVGALKLVVRIYTRLNQRRPIIDTRERYYNGEQPLTFATEEWKKANSARYQGFSDNWAAPVVNAEKERIHYTGMTFDGNKAASVTLHEQWLRNEMDMQSSQGFTTTLTTGRSFVIVWGDKITDQPVVTWEHPSNVEIEYDWANPMLRTAALKTWVDESNEFATLYTPDSIWKYERSKVKVTTDLDSQAKQSRTAFSDDGGWSPRLIPGETWPLRNPMGVVPVVEIPNRPTLKGDPYSEIAGVIPMQDAINLLWAYLFLAADYASMPARVVLNSSPPMIPVLDKDGKVVGEKPVDLKELSEKRLFYVTGDGASIGSWEAARLDVFTSTIDTAVGHIASQTRTPPTYLVSKTGMSNVNGEGLAASEIGLINKVKDFWTFAEPALREVNRLIALAMGDKGLAEATRLAKVNYVNPEIKSDAQLSDAVVKFKQAGFPLEYLLEYVGIPPLDIPRILAMAKKESDAILNFGVQQAVNAPQDPGQGAAGGNAG